MLPRVLCAWPARNAARPWTSAISPRPGRAGQTGPMRCGRCRGLLGIFRALPSRPREASGFQLHKQRGAAALHASCRHLDFLLAKVFQAHAHFLTSLGLPAATRTCVFRASTSSAVRRLEVSWLLPKGGATWLPVSSYAQCFCRGVGICRRALTQMPPDTFAQLLG